MLIKLLHLAPSLVLTIILSVFLSCSNQRQDDAAAAVNQPQAGWRTVGPGGAGAMFEATISPHDPDVFFMRCDMTGAYCTLDGGASWHNFNLRTTVRSFAFDPVDPNTVYACNSGLYISHDLGQRWRLLYPDPRNIVTERMLGDEADHSFQTTDGMPDGPIERIAVDPADNSRLYIAVASRGNQQVKLLVSQDAGTGWKQLATLPGRSALGIFPGYSSLNPDRIALVTDRAFAWVGRDGSLREMPLPAARLREVTAGRSEVRSAFYILAQFFRQAGKLTGGVFRSRDGGASWSACNDGLLGETPAGERDEPLLISVDACAGAPDILYLSIQRFPAVVADSVEEHAGIMKSTDGGDSWHWVYRANEDVVLSANSTEYWRDWSYGPGGWSPWSVGVSPSDPDVCYGAGTRNLRTVDGGVHWEQIVSDNLPDGSSATRGTEGTTTYGVHFDPFDPNHIFITYTDLGAYHSYNGGKSWYHSIKGVPRAWINTMYWMEFDPGVKDLIWGAWTNVHDLPRAKMFRSGYLVNGRKKGGVALSRDGGRTWQPSSDGIPATTVCTHILLDPDSPVGSRTLYVCGFGDGVFKSTDNGKTWSGASNGLGANRNAWRITRLPSGTLFLIVARGAENGQVVDGELWRSVDGAASWQQVLLPEDVNGPNDLIYDPSNPRRMYLSCWPSTTDGLMHGGGLLRTEDGGRSWRRVFDERAHAYAAATDLRNPSTIYLATFESSLFRSNDRGEGWRRLEGFSFKWGHRPVPDPHNPDMLYLTTFGGSVYYGPAEGVPGAFEGIENLDSKWLTDKD